MRTLPSAMRTMLVAGALTTLGTLPVFLLSAQSVLVREELGFSAPQLGLAVSVFFGAAALSSVAAGSLAANIGRRWSTVVAGGLAATGTLGIALGATSYPLLLGLLVVAGVANAALQMTANVTLARSVPAGQRGLAFGVKQSAVPVAILLGGLAVPSIGVLVGWRWTFALASVAAVIVMLGGLRIQTQRRVFGRTSDRQDDRPPITALIVSTVAVTLASAAVNAMGAFLPAWAFQVGLSPGAAGLLLAAASGTCVVARILSGIAADRRRGRNLPIVAAQFAAGAAGLVVLSFAHVPALVAGALLAFAIGWSWPGLLLFAVVRVGRDSPATASGAIQGGAFAGGATGPLLFGLLVSATSYPTAWRVAAAVLVVATAAIVLARRMFVADLVARPPARPLDAAPVSDR